MKTPLALKIATQIQNSPLSFTFAQFMEMALYDDDYGYYSTGGRRERGANARSPIGWEGKDFYTAPCLSSFLAHAVVRQLREIDDLLDRPASLTVVEMGPGDGQFMKDVLDYLEREDPAFLSRLGVVLVERSAMLRSVQETTLASWKDQITWVRDVRELPERSVVGALVSNELVDAFPVHRLRKIRGALQEIYVNVVDDHFIDQGGDLSTEELSQFLDELEMDLPEGFTTEVNLKAVDWMHQVARVLDRGVVLTIDYGHTSQDYISPVRKDGTLLCYYRHTVRTNPYEHVGEQDITAHVNFSSLAWEGGKAGLSLTGFTNLQHFLMSLGIEEMVAELDQDSGAMKAAIELLRPHGMGTTFKVLVQHKGLEVPRLQGLRHRPFFEDVLKPARCGA